MCTQDGTSSLYIASQNGHDRIVEKLLQAKATVDLQDKVVIFTPDLYNYLRLHYMYIH